MSAALNSLNVFVTIGFKLHLLHQVKQGELSRKVVLTMTLSRNQTVYV